MTSRNRNLSIIALVLVLLAGSLYVIFTKPTVLGLDLRGGVELVYEGRPTAQVPKVTPQAIDDAIETIRKRTDSLGVSEPEIQRAGADQISIGLPNVKNAERAVEQVGSTAQLQFYDWEPNIRGSRGPDQPYSGSKALFQAVTAASKEKPKAEKSDLPVGGASDEIKQRYNNDQKKILEYYDRHNDTTTSAQYYLFGPDQRLIAGPDASCEELLSDFETVQGPERTAKQIPKDSKCEEELLKVPVGVANGRNPNTTDRKTGPPPGSQILEVPRGIVVIQAERQKNQPASLQQYFVLEDDTELSGTDIKNPKQSSDQQTNEPIVTMEFTDKGRKAFAAVTKRIAQRGSDILLPPGTPKDAALQRFAITLDNKIVSLATIDFRENPEGIDGRTGAQINGIGNLQDTQDLAESLRIGALPITLKLISQTQVSSTLGQQALDQGLLAGGVGLALTLLFLLLFYRVLGLVAGVALVLYAIFLFAIVKLIPITLTLPGIAGLILTLGVAADANVVIFERVKEEVRDGRSIPAAITAGYQKALRTIIDANVVTIGVAFILFMLATAGVKGFALTLMIGTIVSLFTAVLATSAILGSLARTKLMASRHAIGVGHTEEGAKRWKFDFIGASKWFFSVSGLILVAGALAIAGLGIQFGIDFESGTRIKTPVERAANVDQIRDALAPLGYGDAKIQKVDEPDLGKNVFQIATSTLDPAKVEEVRVALDKKFGVTRQDFSSNSIGPTFGEQIARTAIIAIIASLILISLYIALRFEWKFAVPVLIALSHDILITSGVYALVGREVTTSTVAALLTILGYSLYDTIIVFDRIRENVPRMPRATFSQIVNRSMSEVLTRSLVTSLCTLLPVAALMFFGGETLQDFAFALLVGVASGAYSSIFIASPVLTLWKEREPVYVRRRKQVLADNDGVVPPFATETLGDDEVVDTKVRGNRRSRRRRAAKATPATAAGPAVEMTQATEAPAQTGSAPQPAPAADPVPPPAATPAAPAEADEAEDAGLSAEEKAKRQRARNRARKKHGRH